MKAKNGGILTYNTSKPMGNHCKLASLGIGFPAKVRQLAVKGFCRGQVVFPYLGGPTAPTPVKI